MKMAAPTASGSDSMWHRTHQRWRHWDGVLSRSTLTRPTCLQHVCLTAHPTTSVQLGKSVVQLSWTGARSWDIRQNPDQPQCLQEEFPWGLKKPPPSIPPMPQPPLLPLILVSNFLHMLWSGPYSNPHPTFLFNSKINAKLHKRDSWFSSFKIYSNHIDFLTIFMKQGWTW